MGPRVPFAPALLTLSLLITLHKYLISSLLFFMLYVTHVMVNKAVKKRPSPLSSVMLDITKQGLH